MNNVFPNTPSDGQVEALAILVRNGARNGATRGVDRMERRSLTHRQRGTLQPVLDKLVAFGDAFTPVGPPIIPGPDGQQYGITDQGLIKYRQHPNPRYLALPAEAGPEDE